MKKPCLFLFAFLVGVALIIWAAAKCDAATPTPVPTVTPFDVSQVDFSKISAEDIAETEKHRKELKGEVIKSIDKVVVVGADQGRTLQETADATEAVKKSFRDYQLATETQINKGNQAIAALDHVLKKYHLLKWILCGIWLGFVALVVMKLPVLLKAWSLYIGGGLAVGGLAFIWFGL